MPISVVEPVNPAIERTRRMLFGPIRPAKWFVLGFCAWLAELGSGGGGFNTGVRFPFPGGQAAPRPQPRPPVPVPAPAPAPVPGAAPGGEAAPAVPPEVVQAFDWVQEHLALVIGVGVVVLLVVMGLSLLIPWLRARFTFIFLDNVVHDRAEVAAPWRDFRREGNSLFAFSIALAFVAFLAFLALGGLSVAMAWPDILARRFGAAAVLALAVGLSGFFLLMLTLGVVGVFLTDFVVPIMYLRRQTVMDSWRDFRRELLAGRKFTFFLYLLFQGVIGIATSVIGLGILCVTCCLAAVPLIGSVFLLPLSVFRRQYPLFFLQQFGPEWNPFAATKPTTGGLEFLE